jgi:hypothetical protein
MPYSRPGYMFYATAAATHLHGAPVIYNGVAGVAVKQKVVPAGSGSGAPQKTIANGEDFAIISKGIVQLAQTDSGFAGGAALTVVKGTPLYITAGHLLTTTGPGAGKFGRVVEVAGVGGRGTPTGMMRVDLDKKDSFV